MAEVTPINLAQSQAVQAPIKVESDNVQKVSKEPLYYDCTNLYSPEEIAQIRKRVGAPDPMYPSQYSVKIFNSGAMVIKNESMTNDTVEISKDGGVRHVGSWHNKELAPKGSFEDIVKDAQQRLEKSQNK